MVLVLQRAQRVRDAFDRIRQRVREIVHRIDAPRLTGAVMLGMTNAVEDRVAQIDVRRRHVDFRAQHVRAIRELASAHALEQIEIFCGAAIAIRRILAGLGERATIRPHLVGRDRIDVGDALVDQADGKGEKLFVVIRRVILAFAPVEPEPAHVVFDRIDVFDVFFDRIGVVEAEVAVAAEFLRDPEIEADRLSVADVQIAVWFGREARDDAPPVPSGGDVRRHDLPNEIRRVQTLRLHHTRHGQPSPANVASRMTGFRPRRVMPYEVPRGTEMKRPALSETSRSFIRSVPSPPTT